MNKSKTTIARNDIRWSQDLCSLSVTHICLGTQRESSAEITAVLGSGCSSVVYTVREHEKNGVLKELFPVGLTEAGIIVRKKNGRIRLRKPYLPNHWKKWQQSRSRFAKACRLAIQLQKLPALQNSIVPLYGLYKANGTLYTLSPVSRGCSWDTAAEEDVLTILSIGQQIARMTAAVHEAGWLMIDIKASNYVVDGPDSVLMADFDSAVRKASAHLRRRFFYSTETAPPELRSHRSQWVGEHSDVYSIGAMLFQKLTGKVVSNCRNPETERLLAEKIAPLQDEKKRQLCVLMQSVLAEDPHRRPDCRTLSDSLSRILDQ